MAHLSLRHSRNVPFIALLLALALATAHSRAEDTPAPKPTTAEGWRALTLFDVNAMHALLRDHTPIPFDTQNPAYARWLDEGLAVAQDRAQQVSNEAGYLYTLNGYANGFRDPHFNLTFDRPPAIRWPGFVAVARGAEIVVVQRDAFDPAAPALGARIESCDGQPPSVLVQERVFPFAYSAGMPERWAVPDLFLDRQNPFAPLAASCSVRTGDVTGDIPLRWRRISGVPQTLGADLNREVFGLATTWGVTEPAPGVFWIGIPTFSHSERVQLRALVEAVKGRGKTMRNARAIVIDVRGNAGGTTIWANPLAEAIFTSKVLRAARPKPLQKVALEQRASPENIAYLREFIAGLEGSDVNRSRRVFKKRIKDLERASSRDPPIAHLGASKPAPAGATPPQRPRDAASPFSARVYFLTDGSCSSACLLFADKLLMVPGVRLIGSATSGDTPYGEVRDALLSSGLVTLSIPVEVRRGRTRGTLESYAPDIPYEGSWDDASVRAWTMSLIESGS